MYQEAAPYLAMFEKIVKTSYSTKEDLRNDIRLLGKEHNVIMSIKSSKPTCIYYICKHGGHKRVRSDRGQTTNGRKSKKMLCDAFIQFNYDEVREDWTASRHHGLHNHSIPGNPAAYSINRKMSAELEEEVFADFKSGLTANVIYHALKSRKIFNITKNDLENLQYRFFSAERGKMMYEYITGLQDKGYEVYYKLDSDKRVNGVFFTSKTSIDRVRRMNENLVIDATYKTNAHKLTFVNIVGTSSVEGIKPDTLVTFEVAGAFISEENFANYQWVLRCLKEAVWSDPSQQSTNGPLTITTDNEQALKNAIADVFPTTHNILCYVHMQKRFEAKLMECISDKDKDRRLIIRQEIQKRYQAIALKKTTERDMLKAVQDLKRLFLEEPDIFPESAKENLELQADGTPSPLNYVSKEGKKKAIEFIESKMEEAEMWTAFHTHKLPHMGNRSSNRVESSHSSLKSYLKSSSGTIVMTTEKIHQWYKQREDDLENKKTEEMLSYRSLYTYEEEVFEMIRPLFTKIYSFAVNKIFQELLKIRSAESPVVFKDCLCSIKFHYNLPCKHMLSLESSKVPISIIPQRWRFDHDECDEEMMILTQIEDTLVSDENNNEVLEMQTRDDLKENEDEEVWECENKDDDDDCTIIDATMVPPQIIRRSSKRNFNSRIVSTATKLIELYESLESEQDKRNLIDSVENAMKSVEIRRVEEVLPPKTRVSVKGRPKNVKRNLTHYEHLLKKEEEDSKEAQLKPKKMEVAIKEKEETKLELKIKKRAISQVSYGKDDFVFDMQYRPNKRSRGNISQAVRSILSSSIKESDITGYLDPEGDGNCGFRAIAFLVNRNGPSYEDGEQYLEVRSRMLETYQKLKPIYKEHFPAFQIERLEETIKKGMKKKEIAEWFYGPDCAQVVADTYGVPVCVYPSAELEHSAVNPPLTFLPLELPKHKSKPVAIHLQNGHNLHWYAISLGINQTKLPPVYHYYLKIKGKQEEYNMYWNKWRQFSKRQTNANKETIIIE